MSRMTLRVMMVDDHAMVLAGYARLLELEGDLQVVAQYTSAEDAYQDLQAGRTRPDVVMLDLSMPGRSGLELLRRVRQRSPHLAMLVCTMHDAPAMVEQALRAGANGVVTKSSDPALLPAAIRTVAQGVRFLSPDIALDRSAAEAQAPHLKLSPREFSVFVRLVQGDSLDHIAEATHIAPKTVANLQSLIRSKLGVANAVEMVHYAQRHGIGGPA